MSAKIIKFRKENKRKSRMFFWGFLFLFLVSGICSCLLFFKLFSLFISLISFLVDSFLILYLLPFFIGLLVCKKIKNYYEYKNYERVLKKRNELRIIKNDNLMLKEKLDNKLVKNNSCKYSYCYNDCLYRDNLKIARFDNLDNSNIKKRVKCR